MSTRRRKNASWLLHRMEQYLCDKNTLNVNFTKHDRWKRRSPENWDINTPTETMLVNGIDIQESKGITDQTWVVVTLREEWEGGEGQGGDCGVGMKNSRILFLHCKSTKHQLLKIFLLYFYISFLILTEYLGWISIPRHIDGEKCLEKPAFSKMQAVFCLVRSIRLKYIWERTVP